MAMASMLLLLRASRLALRAAPSPALVASASNRPLRNFLIASRYYGRGRASDRDFPGDPDPATPVRLVADTKDDLSSDDFVADTKDDLSSDEYSSDEEVSSYKERVKFKADAKDLASDEALWALYERWCKAFGEHRTPDEMRRYFNNFKKTVFIVDREKNDAIVITRFADGKRWEKMKMRGSYNDLFWRLKRTRVETR